MKIRSGFVSNSSSSSFVVYGNVIDHDGIDEAMKSHKVLCVMKHRGASGSNDDFVFNLTNHRLQLLEKRGIDISNAMFVEILKVLKDRGNRFEITEPLTGGTIIEIRKDYSSPKTDSDEDNDFNDWVSYHAVK